ncbi:MAG: short-chain fatty acid transporter [Deltaproteobacteria bacterium]|nr:MAG: short-chain fatty acid transporter [Deltaproteobacteria bacterium]
MGPIARLALAARYGFGRIVPEPFVVAVGLAALVVGAALLFGMAPSALLDAWATTGLWRLSVFAMQMALMLLFGGALARAPAVEKALSALVGLGRGPRSLVAIVAFASACLGVLNWSLGLVGGALLARAAGIRARREGMRLHYPILCAAGYAGLSVWHGGLSGSAPLKAASLDGQREVLGAELASRVGALPLGETLFGPMNLVVTGGLVVLAPLVFAAMVPDHDPDPRPCPASFVAPASAERDGETGGLLQRIEDAAVVSWVLALLLGAGFVHRIAAGRFDFDTVVLGLWTAAVVAHGTPSRFLRACEESVHSCTGVLVQFPLYAGIMGVMAASGLSAALATGIAAVGPGGFLPAVFASAALINLFVPSGGGQWAVQGPIVLEAAERLGVEPAHALLAVAYGDQWTNMLQPFWALPLLAITGIRARHLVGLSAVWMLVAGIWILSTMTWMGA